VTNVRADGGELNHRDRAIHALAAERFDRAADLYTLAAYGTLSGHEGFGRTAFDADDPGWVGDPLSFLVLAGLCDRIAGREDRARNRTSQGVLLASDQREHVLTHPVRRAACDEFVGDLCAVAGREEKARAAYERAADTYREYDPDDDPEGRDPVDWTTQPPLQAGTDLVAHVSRPNRVTWDDLHGSEPSRALVHRAEFRRSRFRSLVEARVDAGKLHAPRGSTEYNTGRWRCPDCGSDDVNYVAETTLCLRCSAQSERA
jgi:hypothetical protein